MAKNHRLRYLWPALAVLVSALACRLVTDLNPLAQASPTAMSQATDVPATTAGATIIAGATEAGAGPGATAQATGTVLSQQATVLSGAATPTWVPPAALPGPFDDETPTADQERAVAELAVASPPVRDDVALALAYGGLTQEMLDEQVALPAPQPGERAPFNVLNIDSNFNVSIEAQLYFASEHAYFWFDTTLPEPQGAALEEAGRAFDDIYEANVNNFGEETRPGIDGDERLHVLNAAPGAICNDAARCGLLGYFSSSDALPRLVNEYSNERDMFVMNGEYFGTATYIHVLAHEFRHTIEDNYDPSDADWEVEGSAMLAEELAGYPFSAIDRGNAFLENPDQQLNRWSDGNTYAHYGQGYVLNRYIYDRLGATLYREFATNPADGLQAVSAVAGENGLEIDGMSLWLDWLAALAIHRHPQAPDIYRLGDGSLNSVAMTAVEAPAAFDTTVRQYAADYYHIQDGDSLTIQFSGSRQTPLLDVGAASGRQYWYAQRVNYSHMQLERDVDLRSVASATLGYDVYYDIEAGYDFAYVSISEDGGVTWQGLQAPGMQGLQEGDDPGDAALTDRFYTGKSQVWVQEQIDLTPYAGKEVKLRFSYITDPILTFGGLALDNISIPEIAFYDDAEGSLEGWQAQGFTRTTAALPQSWRLQLITFENGAPVVNSLTLDQAATLQESLDLAQSNGEAILIVAAAAPMTLEEAVYRLEFRD